MKIKSLELKIKSIIWMLPNVSVILNIVKDLALGLSENLAQGLCRRLSEILRCAQDDTIVEILNLWTTPIILAKYKQTETHIPRLCSRGIFLFHEV